MNLIEDHWIPVIRQKSGERVMIRPFEITDGIGKDPYTLLDAPRPDFNAAMIQFLIGMIQTVKTPKDDEEWLDSFQEPPSIEELREAMNPISRYFQLDGDGPRFMQDLELTDGTVVDIGALLIDAPGANGIKNNTDHFVKRGRTVRLCPACTATALFTLQSNAPAGGKGQRTSLRGGGPLTTVAIPDGSQPEMDTLWHRLWLNILSQKELSRTGCALSSKKVEDKYPWITPTKISEEKGSEIVPDEVHPVHIFWSMPRRIRLQNRMDGEAVCDICGNSTVSYYTSYITKPYGNNYGTGIYHPLSPYYSDKDGNRLPVHPQPGGFVYRHWPLYVSSMDPKNPRALVLQRLDGKLEKLEDELKGSKKGSGKVGVRVHIFGYDMDNMKARCWYETQMPYWLIDERVRADVITFASRLAESARMVASNTRKAIRNAWFDPNETLRGDLSYIESEFWNSTEVDYYNHLRAVETKLKEDDMPGPSFFEMWLSLLNTESLRIYDFYADQVPLDAGNINGVPRVIKARDQLGAFNRFGKNIREILGLEKVAKAKGERK